MMIAGIHFGAQRIEKGRDLAALGMRRHPARRETPPGLARQSTHARIPDDNEVRLLSPVQPFTLRPLYHSILGHRPSAFQLPLIKVNESKPASHCYAWASRDLLPGSVNLAFVI